ncbi:Putative universal stress protein [Legionella massiliensis]|uniref:Putative universal stress protein n=1 Tax=Legionella massiliensis TaxID=1034943 RepID=A0A078L0R9_9GAMM|nr:universal stress protein [Legionella massiliensis]CDZ77618.1 Putative universal stress protein [Legionella massiliensis]CEE13356.1 Putative universal stress protein [Legionella massiliensis]
MIYKNIMVAIDGSSITEAVLHETIKLIKGNDKEINLRILSVIDETAINYSGGVFDYQGYFDACKEAGHNLLARAKEIITPHSTAKIETYLLELKPFGGRLSELIIKEAQAWPADLLILGTHGRRGFSRLIIGSVAENVLRLATMSVLLVRGKNV